MGFERNNANEWTINEDGQGKSNNKDLSSSDEGGSKVQLGHGEIGVCPARTTPSTSVTRTPPKVQTLTWQNNGRFFSKPPTPNLSSGTMTPRKAYAHRFTNSSRPKPNITFVKERDNQAKVNWKNRRPCNGVFVSRRNWNEVSPDFYSKTFYAKLEEMGAQLGTYIQPPSNKADRSLRIWGSDSQVQKTKEELLIYCSSQDVRPDKQRGSEAHFIVVRPQSQKQRKLMEDEMALLQKKMFYKQVPDDGSRFQFTGAFLWPTDDVDATELLGKNCEALDGIRSHCNCYIEFDSHLSLFKLKATNMGRVLGALQRIEGTLKEYMMRISRPKITYMLEPPSKDEIRQEVKLVALSNKKNALVTTGPKLSGQEVAEWAVKSARLRAKNKARMQKAITKTLSSLLYYRGRLRMRVLLGNFAFSLVRWPQGAPSVPFDTFVDDNIKKSANKGTILKGLQIKGGPEAVLDQFWNMREHLQPANSMTKDLKDVSPKFIARFEFNKTALGRVRLEIEMAKNFGSHDDWTKEEVRWTQIPGPDSQDTAAQPSPLELNMIGLNGRTSWQLCILMGNVIERARLTSEMMDFAKAVKFNPPLTSTGAAVTGKRTFTIPGLGYLPINSFEQKTALRYQMCADPDYVFEVARYDMYRQEGISHSSQKPNTIRDLSMIPSVTDWGASLYNDTWDGLLAKNSKLELGQMAAWTPTLDTFFPQDPRSKTAGPNAGFTDFLNHTRRITQLLDQTKSKLISNGLHDDRTKEEIDALYEDSDGTLNN